MGKMPDQRSVIISVSTIRRVPPGTWLSDAGGLILRFSIPFDEPEKGVIESLTPGTIDTAGHYLNLAPLLS